MANRSTDRGFTLVELLVVIAIIALLIALLVPAVQGAREAARRIQCGNNIKQLGVALQAYSVNHGAFPAGTMLQGVTPTSANTTWCRAGPSNGFTPWTVSILPFIEEQAVHDRFTLGFTAAGRFMQADFTVPSPNIDQVVPIQAYQCPSSTVTHALRNNYYGVQGGGPTPACRDGLGGNRQFFINGILYANSRINTAHIRDGTSNVLILGETRWCSLMGSGTERFTWVTSGKSESGAIPIQVAGMSLPLNTVLASNPTHNNAMNFGTRGFGSDHPGGCLFGLADGSVHFISDTASDSVLQLLAGRSDDGQINEVLP